MRYARLLPLALTIAAAPVATTVPAPLLDHLIADTAALPPGRLAFDRTTHAVRTGGGTTTTSATTDRWNGKRWTLTSTHNRQPSVAEASAYKRQADAIPVPGYYQLGPIIAAATTSSTDAQGRTLLHIPVLPAGAIHTDTGDISGHLQGEARLARHGDTVWVDQLRVAAREDFKMTMLIKVTGFEQISDYAPGADGKPRLMTQKSTSTGSMFGFPGGESAEASFVYR